MSIRWDIQGQSLHPTSITDSLSLDLESDVWNWISCLTSSRLHSFFSERNGLVQFPSLGLIDLLGWIIGGPVPCRTSSSIAGLYKVYAVAHLPSPPPRLSRQPKLTWGVLKCPLRAKLSALTSFLDSGCCSRTHFFRTHPAVIQCSSKWCGWFLGTSLLKILTKHCLP